MNLKKRKFFWCASVSTLLFTSQVQAGILKSKERLDLPSGESVPLTWLRSDNARSTPRALVLVQHGMMRKAENMIALAQTLVEKNLEVLLPTVKDSQVLQSSFPESFTQAILEKKSDPQGNPLPNKILMIGFSAGARFLNHVASVLLARQHDVRGIVFLDPVVGSQSNQQLGPRLPLPYLTILGTPHRCNAYGNSYSILTSGQFDVEGFRLKNTSHCDFEGESTDSMCQFYCGSTSKINGQAIQLFASEWISSLVDSDKPNADYLPGGKVFLQWQNKGFFDAVLH